MTASFQPVALRCDNAESSVVIREIIIECGKRNAICQSYRETQKFGWLYNRAVAKAFFEL